MTPPVHEKYPAGSTVFHGLRLIEYGRGKRGSHGGIRWWCLWECGECGRRFWADLYRVRTDRYVCKCALATPTRSIDKEN